MTLVTHQRQCLFGEIVAAQIVLSPVGKIVQEEWFASLNIRKEIRLDPEDFVIMPNHIHGVVQIVDSVGAHGMRPFDGNPDNQGGRRPPLQRSPQSLSSFIAGFKSSVTKRVMALDETITGSIWQRNFYEHIIRNKHEWARIRAYIEINPTKWNQDEENPNK
jgi:putative transposase